MGFKDMYHSAEDAWYSFLDQVENHLPIYRVIDPIDKAVPSFAVFLAGILLLLLVFVGMPLLGGGNADIVLAFRDEQGNPVSGMRVTIAYGDVSLERTTNSVGKIPLSGIPVGTTLFLSAQPSEYDSLSEEVTIEDADGDYSFTLSLQQSPSSELSFQFTDLGGLSLSGKQVSILLSCTSGVPLPSPSYSTTNGVFSITPPPGCGNLVGSVSASGYITKDGVVFSTANPIIGLQPLVLESGKVKVTVRDAHTNAVLPGMDAELISSQGVSMDSIPTNSFGVSIFNGVTVGSYTVSISDPNGAYAITLAGETVTVSANQTVSVDVKLGKQVQGIITVHVNDKTNGSSILDAVVKLVRKNDNQLMATQRVTSGDTALSFEVTEQGPFLLTASHPNYLAQSKDIGLVAGASSHTFALEKLTAANSGKVSVNVKDEDGLPVDNAQVLLYDSATGFITHANDPRITDVNGTATFMGVASGTYFARATKYPAGPSDSESFTTDKSTPAQTSIVMKIGQATVQVNAKDVEGNPIPFALVHFLTDGSDECTPGKCAVQSDASGVASKSFKADRKVYANVTAPGFSGFTSTSIQLHAGKVETISAKLLSTILGDSPRIVFVDVKDPLTNTSANEIKAGKAYTALFQLHIPTALELDTAGVHIRAGDESLSINDSLRILSIQIPNTSVIKGTSYQPEEGYDADQENLTNGEAKWVNAQWDNPSPGVYEFSVTIRANADAGVLDPLTLHYRAWGIEDGEWLRDPVDIVLGSSSGGSGNEGQYAEAYQKTYFNGKPIVCADGFCFSGETLFNTEDELLVEGTPYSVSVNKPFTYSFVLTSSDTITYENPRLRAFISQGGKSPSEEAVFTDYRLIGTNGQAIEAHNLSLSDIPGGEGQGIDVGEMVQHQNISGEFSFLTKEVGDTQLILQLINEGDIVFERTVELDIYSTNTLHLDVSPETASAFVPTEFLIHVTDGQGFDIPDALVSLLKIDPNKSQQFIAQKLSDPAGKVSFIAPPSHPYTHFIFDATKGGYASTPVEIIVDTNIVRFNPTTLSFQLPNAPNTEQFLPLDITNLSQETLLVKEAILTGDFQGFLSNGEMQNYVNQYEGVTSIGPNQEKTIQVKASTSPTVNVLSNKGLKGNLSLTFESTATGQEWVQNVPLNVDIKVITDCDEGGILLSGTPASGELITTSFNSKSQTPFQILNTCMVDGQPFPLKNLKAKVVWKSQPIGNVELAITDIEASNQAVEVLKNGSYVPFFEEFRTSDDTIYESLLTFTPFPKQLGETAQFTITLSGEAGTGSKIQNISQSFDAEIKITNLESCITFDPEPEEGITIESDEEEAVFTIDATECGEVPVDVWFCAGTGNENCRGGAPEGRLYLSQFTINDLEGKKEITLERKGGTLPGSYDLTVDARVPGISYYRIATLDVEVESDTSYAFDMEKPGFILYAKDARDSSNIINRKLMESVKV
ncbi:MAG: carboxypeptidase-like regulatory domain-containing protein, partial [archaeon]